MTQTRTQKKLSERPTKHKGVRCILGSVPAVLCNPMAYIRFEQNKGERRFIAGTRVG